MNTRPAGPPITSADSAPCQSSAAPSRARCSRAPGRSRPSLWLAPPELPSRTRWQAWHATSSPRANTAWTMTSGPVTACCTRTPPPRPKMPRPSQVAASRRSASVEVTRQTPADAVPIGVFTKTGSPSSAASSSSAAVAASTASGCGRPTRVNVPNADTLSCTWASAPNSGTAVASPAASIRSRASDITATCSCTGSSRSARRRAAMPRAASSHPNGSRPTAGTGCTRRTCRVTRARQSPLGDSASTWWPARASTVAHCREVSPAPSLSSICTMPSKAHPRLSPRGLRFRRALAPRAPFSI